MTVLGLVSDRRRATATLRVYTIEYTSSEHRGIIMHSETHEAASAADALVYAEGGLSGVAARFGARGYRVKDAEGCYHSSDGSCAEAR
jgi:hypothetical protein